MLYHRAMVATAENWSECNINCSYEFTKTCAPKQAYRKIELPYKTLN